MADAFHNNLNSLEPFPLFIDSAPPNSANYFSSPIAMAAVQLVAAASATTTSSPFSSSSSTANILQKPHLVIPRRLSNYVRLRYYQYEVTFGLYMLTSREKLIFNTMILSVFAALLYAMSWGCRAFLVNGFCRLLWHLTGEVDGKDVSVGMAELCAPS